jgi:hypothetical protein
LARTLRSNGRSDEERSEQPEWKQGVHRVHARTVPLEEQASTAWWHGSDRYAERLAPEKKFADSICEIDYSNGFFV